MDKSVLSSLKEGQEYVAPVSEIVKISVQGSFLVASPGAAGEYNSDEDTDYGIW